ncbi:MAG: endonuclease/exonuclease/phosphatase family protein, partial [Acidobacteriota bacterium]
MKRSTRESSKALRITLLSLTLSLSGCGQPEAPADRPLASTETEVAVRVASFNIKELGRDKLDSQSLGGFYNNPQLSRAAQIIQRIRPDVLLINEIDFDAETRENAALFVQRFLKIPQDGRQPIDYPYIFFEPSNTGEPSGHDLDNDGTTDGPADAYGFGRYPGQYAMALLSQLPIDRENSRTFQQLLWRDMPGHRIPDGQDGRPEWYNAEELEILRLSSKSHWDVP